MGLEKTLDTGDMYSIPDIPVASILMNTIDNSFHRINLVRTHNHQLLLTRNQNHIPANHLP